MPGSVSERLGNLVPVASWEDAFASIDETSGSTRHLFVTACHVNFNLKLTLRRGNATGQFDPYISGAAAEVSFDPRSGKNLPKTSVQGRGCLDKRPSDVDAKDEAGEIAQLRAPRRSTLESSETRTAPQSRQLPHCFAQQPNNQ